MTGSDIRVAILSDLHGNLTAFEAVLADLRDTAPDLILHGGDLADAGSDPAEVIDRVRGLGWRGVKGNTDEMLFAPESFEAVVARAPQFASLWSAVREVADDARERLGAGRLAWLQSLPPVEREGSIALVHASPASAWRAPAVDAEAAEMEAAFGPLESAIVIYGHLHRPRVRVLESMTVVNAGSVSLSHDSDPRASYVILDGGQPAIRRVEYDFEREIRRMRERKIPRADWLAESLRSATPVLP